MLGLGMSLDLRATTAEDLLAFPDMEREQDVAPFVFGFPLAQHQETWRRPEVRYLSILLDQRLVGFFLLALEDGDGATVEFRRIVVGAGRGTGVGQRAIAAMHAWCRSRFATRRIHLDVFAANLRARHVYEKLGYVRYGERSHERGPLLLYEKRDP